MTRNKELWMAFVEIVKAFDQSSPGGGLLGIEMFGCG